MTKHYRLIGDAIPGVTIQLDYAIEFLLWANGVTPSAQAIMNRLEVSRATAYRYRRAYQTVLEKYGSLKFERARRID